MGRHWPSRSFQRRAWPRHRRCARRSRLWPRRPAWAVEHRVDRAECSMIDRSPRAPVFRASALRAIACSADHTSARRLHRRTAGYCLTSAFFGSVRIWISAVSSVSSSSVATTGSRPPARDQAELDQIFGLDLAGTSRPTLLGLRCAPWRKADAGTSVRFWMTFRARRTRRRR